MGIVNTVSGVFFIGRTNDRPVIVEPVKPARSMVPVVPRRLNCLLDAPKEPAREKVTSRLLERLKGLILVSAIRRTSPAIAACPKPKVFNPTILPIESM